MNSGHYVTEYPVCSHSIKVAVKFEILKIVNSAAIREISFKANETLFIPCDVASKRFEAKYGETRASAFLLYAQPSIADIPKVTFSGFSHESTSLLH